MPATPKRYVVIARFVGAYEGVDVDIKVGEVYRDDQSDIAAMIAAGIAMLEFTPAIQSECEWRPMDGTLSELQLVRLKTTVGYVGPANLFAGAPPKSTEQALLRTIAAVVALRGGEPIP
jgi:hypothetical protein